MTFTIEQKFALTAPLNRAHVKSRSQSGRSLSYIEAWRAIDEANKIFGFDGWTSETVEIRCVSEKERKIGTQKKDGWGVSYIAKVKVVVFAGDTIVTREGVGSGHGIDVDLGLAHESAIKEAESDSRKRALMTFGNPFGLALYDKTQANVIDDRDPEKVADEWAERRGRELIKAALPPVANEVVWDEDGERPAVPGDFEATTGALKDSFIHEVREHIRKAADAKSLGAWWNSDQQKTARRDFGLTDAELKPLKNFCVERIKAIGNGAAA